MTVLETIAFQGGLRKAKGANRGVAIGTYVKFSCNKMHFPAREQEKSVPCKRQFHPFDHMAISALCSIVCVLNAWAWVCF